MKTNVLKYVTFGFLGLMAMARNDTQSDLLEPKVYFDSKEFRSEVPAESDEIVESLQARLTSPVGQAVNVQYEVLGQEVVDQFNKRNGTEYIGVSAEDVTLEESSSTIPAGECYAQKLPLVVKNVQAMAEGKTYVLPIRISQASLPMVDGGETAYYIFSKPVRIMKAMQFGRGVSAIKPNWELGKLFNSVTYEALIYPTRLNDNHTIMGVEGTLILRIGDAGGGKPANMMQVAGKMEFAQPEPYIETNKWTHVAFTYDKGSGKAVMYVNGEKVSESSSGEGDFDFTDPKLPFMIGSVYGFMWGQRPFYGYMSEVRVWTVARTANQIKQNMLVIDPNADGLSCYYKLNGDDVVSEGGGWKVEDASANGIDGIGLGSRLELVELDEPIAVN